MKIFLLVVLIIQLCLINYFVGSNDLFWGFIILWQLMNGSDWRINGFFPRVPLKILYFLFKLGDFL